MNGDRPRFLRSAAAVLLSLLAAFGVLAAPAPPQLSAASGLIEESQSTSPRVPVASVTHTTARSERRRRLRPVARTRPLRTMRRWPLRPWTLPLRVVGGAPPGRAPPSLLASS